MYRLTITLIFALLICNTACKKDSADPFSIKGKVADARNGSGLPEVTIKVEKQAVQNGVYSSNYARALTTTTRSDGYYEGTWERETFTSLKLIAEKNSYIPVNTVLTEQEIGSGEITKNVTMHPEAFVSLQFIHNSNSANDYLSYNFINTNFDCACCKPGWKDILDDTAVTCKVYGDHWLNYEIQTHIDGVDSSYTDSIWCPAFITTSKTIHY
jgi:hypothetical protein